MSSTKYRQLKGVYFLKDAKEKYLVFLVILFAAAAIIVTCIMFNASLDDDKQTIEETSQSLQTDISEKHTTDTDTDTQETEIIYQNVPVVIPDIDTQNFNYTVEAEDTAIYGSLYCGNTRPDYSGTGYVTGFDGEKGNRILFYFYIPSLQHYDITVRYASDMKTSNSVTADGKKIGTIETDGNYTGFKETTFEGVFLDEGYVEIEVVQDDGNFDLDYIEINNNEYVYENDSDVMKKLSNENASAEANSLMSYLVDMYGKGIITGQYVSSPANTEIKVLEKLTGRYPVIRFAALSGDSTVNEEQIKAAENWVSSMGGITGLMWYWNAPSGGDSIYAEETSFDLSRAVTDKDIALRDIDELEKMCSEGKISEECVQLVKDIDEISAQLKYLKKAKIPVLWRPLHEAGGEWYWWGSAGSDAYKWLWELLYKRQTVYHDLNNLIWLWNGQSKNYVIDENLYDIASVDVYEGDEADYGSHFQQYKWLYMLTEKKKLVALSECGTVPDINEIFRDNAMFSFFGLWYGNYVVDENGDYSEEYTSAEAMKKMYNSDGAITLDEYIKGEKPSESIVIETQATEEY